MKIRADILSVYRNLHIWTGIISGLVLFIGFYAGSLSMFKPAIDNWVRPAQHILPVIENSQLDNLVNQVLSQHVKARNAFTIHLSTKDSADKLQPPQESPMVWFEGKVERELNLNQLASHASLDQHGQMITQQVLPSALAQLIDLLHRTAGIPGTAGHEFLGVYILGVAAILYFLAIVSGLILLLPSLKKTFLALRTNKNKLRFWLDAHNIIGITSLPFHIVICLSVIVFAFHDEFYDSLRLVVYGEQPMFTDTTINQPVKDHNLTMLTVSQLVQQSKQLAPSYQVTDMVFMNLNSPRPLVRIGLYDETQIMRGPITDYIFIQPFSGAVLNSTLTGTQETNWSALVAGFFALHFGSYGGNLVRWIYFFLGFSGAFLFYSGNLLWLEKRRIKQKNNAATVTQTRSCQLMAAATVGVCLGSMLAVTCSMLFGKWLYFLVDNINQSYLAIYYSIFLIAVISAFILAAARAAIYLLRLNAIVALLFPLTSLLDFIFNNFQQIPNAEIFANHSISTLSVDLVALVFSGVFFYLAERTKVRAITGETDSVWSLTSGH